jgi:hypothetical protein
LGILADFSAFRFVVAELLLRIFTFENGFAPL